MQVRLSGKAGPHGAAFKGDKDTVLSPASTLPITFFNLYFANVFSAEATCHHSECQRIGGRGLMLPLLFWGWVDDATPNVSRGPPRHSKTGTDISTQEM